MDDFARYLHAQRHAARLTPAQFWPAYLGTLARFLALTAAIAAVSCVPALLRHFKVLA